MQATRDTSSHLLTACEVADRLGISVRQVRRLYGDLGAFHVGRLVRFDPHRVEMWLADRIAEADARRR